MGSDIIFVGGCMRSGTTLLHRTLCQTEASNPFIQASFYLTRQLEIYQRTLQQGDDFIADMFGDRDGLTAFTSAIINRLLGVIRERWDDPEVLILKQTEITRFIPLLVELIPEALFVVSVRDPRDTVCSMLEVGERHAKQQQNSIYSRLGRNVGALSEIYNNMYRPLMQACEASPDLKRKTSFVLYEDLAQSAKPTITKLADFTGLPLQAFAETESYRPEPSRSTIRSHPYWGAYTPNLTGSPISSESVGKHRLALTQSEISVVESTCSGMMTRFGYI